MSIFNKLFTALKGNANELGEAIVDANAITIFEQELREARSSLANAKEIEISMIAKKKQSEIKLTKIEEDIAQYEQHAIAALDQDNETLALEIAAKIAALQKDKSEEQLRFDNLTAQAEKLNKDIQKTDSRIREMENELSQVKANETVLKAQESLHSSMQSGSSNVASAKESLERIKERQAYKQALNEAAEELESASSLDKKLEEAGITKTDTDAMDVLAKLKAKRA